MSVITNKFKGVKCAICREPIQYDDPMEYDKYGAYGQKNFHPTCWNEKIGASSMKPVETPSVPNIETNSNLAAVIAAALQPFMASQLDHAAIKALVESTVIDAVSALKLDAGVKRIEIVNVERNETIDLGVQHKDFETLLKRMSARDVNGNRLNHWITGSAGTGKSVGIKNAAKALGLEFSDTGSLTESHTIFGFVSPITGAYMRTPCRDRYEHGGVFAFDDFDGSDPVCVVEMLGLFANGHASFPDGMVKRHHDCIFAVSANTWGHGGTDDYVGRLKQDKAFLNRFVMLNWEIDEKLETATCGNADWSKVVQKVRSAVNALGIKVLVTPRASYYGAALLSAGLSQSETLDATIFHGMTIEQRKSVLARTGAL